MKHWIAEHILTTEDLFREETIPISNQEFFISLGMLIGALSIFGVLIHF